MVWDVFDNVVAKFFDNIIITKIVYIMKVIAIIIDIIVHLMVWDVFDNVVAADRLGFKVPPDLRLVLRSQQREIVRISCNFQMLEITFNYVQ